MAIFPPWDRPSEAFPPWGAPTAKTEPEKAPAAEPRPPVRAPLAHPAGNDRPTWEYQHGTDTPEAFPAFSYFLRIARPRRIASIAGAFGVSAQTVYKWAREQSWHLRALAYDKSFADLQQAEIEAVTKETAQEAAAQWVGVCRTLLQTAEIEAAKRQQQSLENAGPVMQPRDILRTLDIAFKVERLNRGEPTEIEGEGYDYSKLSDDEFRALRALRAKAKKEGGA